MEIKYTSFDQILRNKYWIDNAFKVPALKYFSNVKKKSASAHFLPNLHHHFLHRFVFLQQCQIALLKALIPALIFSPCLRRKILTFFAIMMSLVRSMIGSFFCWGASSMISFLSFSANESSKSSKNIKIILIPSFEFVAGRNRG